MERLAEYFNKAKTCVDFSRKIGLEVETLFIDGASQEPITLEVSQGMMFYLIENLEWKLQQSKNGKAVCLEKDGYWLTYDLGWNNFELITPPTKIDSGGGFPSGYYDVEQNLEDAARKFNAEACLNGWDGCRSNTLIMPDKRDEIWLELDGPALFSLGHIAAIHVNIDLCSMAEGESFIKKLLSAFQAKDWPYHRNRRIWQYYIDNSLADYEADRYGPPPCNFTKYCEELAAKKVVMNSINGDLRIAKPASPFGGCPEVDIDMFLRSVWWWYRLRVRSGRLVLEIRDLPRSAGAEKCLKFVIDTLTLKLPGPSQDCSFH